MPTKHITEHPDQGAFYVDYLWKRIQCLCPQCRLVVLGFLCGAAIKQIKDEQQEAYMDDLINHIDQAVDMEEVRLN